jgi:hypothetical protein
MADITGRTPAAGLGVNGLSLQCKLFAAGGTAVGLKGFLTYGT